MSTAETTTLCARELRALCGAEHVVEDPAALGRLQILGVVPSVAVSPGSAEEIAAVLRLANKHTLSVVPAGGFTQPRIGNVPVQTDILLETSRLTGIEHYDPGDLTIGIGAGCPVAELSATVAKDGLLFAGDPPLPERASVGGMLATNLTGPLRHGFGGLRDYCIGIRFVTGDGRTAKGGGRVVKNVAGYDLMKLLIGSQGTLAVITSASFKLFPAPRQMRTFLAEFATASEAIAFRDSVLRSPLQPICLELASPEAQTLLTGDMQFSAWSVWVRAAGSDAVLARHRAELGSAVAHEIEGEAEQRVWTMLRDFPAILRERFPQSLLTALSTPLAGVKPALTMLSTAAEGAGLKLAAVGRIGVGHLLAGLWADVSSNAATTPMGSAVSKLRAELPQGCSMAILHRPEGLQREINTWGPMPAPFASMRAVKQALDRNDILNRGRFLF